jgi:hypothetical protein
MNMETQAQQELTIDGIPQEAVDSIFAEIATRGASNVFLQAAQFAAQKIKEFDARVENELKTKQLTDEEATEIIDTFNGLSRLCASFQTRFIAAKAFDAIESSTDHVIQ